MRMFIGRATGTFAQQAAHQALHPMIIAREDDMFIRIVKMRHEFAAIPVVQRKGWRISDDHGAAIWGFGIYGVKIQGNLRRG